MSTTPAFVVDTTHSPFARLRPVPINAVHLSDPFLEARRRVNREHTLLSQYDRLEESGVLDNFRRVADPALNKPFSGVYWFMDTDLYKWLEAAASALCDPHAPLAPLRERIETAIGLMEKAQRPDGYLNTYFARERADERWTNLRDWHELYNVGHLLQACVAHYRATGDKRLLELGKRVADNVCDTFGPEESGKIPGTDGHPEVEMALVELSRATGDTRYREQAQFFIDARGRVPSQSYDRRRPEQTQTGTPYHQDHVPYRDLADVTGHAVRMLYLASGATDVYLETGEPALKMALDRQWENLVTRRQYVSGGAGSRYEGEAFGKDYELPAERAYTETCAAIAGVMWAYRMLLATGEARYADAMEWTLYNAVLPGLSHDGEHYFYQNPLEDDGTHRRRAWFGCACCPPNVARLLAQLPGYFCALADDGGVYVNLYAAGEAHLALPGGASLAFTIESTYPWNGDITLRLTNTPPSETSLHLRIPGWVAPESDIALTVNDEISDVVHAPGSWATVRRIWQAGDTVRLHLPLPVHALEAHPFLRDARGRVALTRGPLLYCVEAADNPAIDDLRDLAIDPAAPVELLLRDDLLPGAVLLRGQGKAGTSAAEGWNGGTLYRTAHSATVRTGAATPTAFTAVPYCLWANRDAGQMAVWLLRI